MDKERNIKIVILSPISVLISIKDQIKGFINCHISNQLVFSYKKCDKMIINFKNKAIDLSKEFIISDSYINNNEFIINLDAILSDEEINSSYSRDDGLKQLDFGYSLYAFKELEVKGTEYDIGRLTSLLNRMVINKEEDDLILACINTLAVLIRKIKKYEYARYVIDVYENYSFKTYRRGCYE